MSESPHFVNSTAAVQRALEEFGGTVTGKMSQITSGEPEEQLRGPFEILADKVGGAFGWRIVCTGETPLAGRLGKPDFAIHVGGLLAGYVELKAPGTGANAKKFKGRNREQFKRFSLIPNLLYSDGNEWALYRDGGLIDRAVLPGDVASDGSRAVSPEDAAAFENLLRNFLSWEPIPPFDSKGKIDLRRFAAMLAPLCRMVRDDVTDALADAGSPLVHLAKDWRQLLFPDASDDQFADAYAQTLTFALLLGRSEGADPLTLASAEAMLAAKHNLLSKALQVLTDSAVQKEMEASLPLLVRVISVVPPAALRGPEDPWLYFYEDFLAEYDPKLRKDVGAYYTPVEVVRCQVRLIDDLLVNRLNKPLGFADPGVVTLDPAAGTGTYLLGVIEHALKRVESEQGPGAVAGQATTLAKNLYGFELMVGPYAVTELRISRALSDRGAVLPKDGTHIYLTDTLESPYAEPRDMPLFLRPIAEQHARALQVKSDVPVIVCLGNPPYDRHAAATSANKAQTGGWVRWGESNDGSDAIIRDFTDPAIASGHGVHIKNIYNLYVYFWRWALWKVFEHETSTGAGVVSFISASSYLDGDAFCGMREHMRRHCDEIWILDIGGEGRGTRRTQNVFAIQTPVAIAIAVKSTKTNRDRPARVNYACIEGSRNVKLSVLDSIDDFSRCDWKRCPDEWQAPFRLRGEGVYFSWPLLTDLLPWQHSGAQFKRTWPISPDREVLAARWKALLAAKERAVFLKETRDRKISSTCPPIDNTAERLPALNELRGDSPCPEIRRYGYRSFDVQHAIVDCRVGDFLRPVLWRSYGDRQIHLTTAFTQPLSIGPAISASAAVPDLHHFSGRGAKDTIPLFRTADASKPNIVPGVLELLSGRFNRNVTLEDFAAYVYGVLAQPAFTKQFANELATRQLRVPITKDAALFEKVRAIGARLLWLHTYGERFVPKGMKRGQVPRGDAKCTKAVLGDPDNYPGAFDYNEATRTLRVGAGEFAPVSPEVYEFEVSGLKVVQSWLKYRMKHPSGKKSSPLDDIRPERWTSQFTTQLLELLWVLEATVQTFPEQATLLDAVVESDWLTKDDLPDVPEEMRSAPKVADEDLSQIQIEDA